MGAGHVGAGSPWPAPVAAGPGPGYLPPPPLPPSAGRPRRRRWPVALAVLAAVLTFVGVAAAFVELPYDSVAPGQATSVQGLLSISGHPTFPSEGEILFTTVSVLERVNVYEYLRATFDSTIDVIPERRIRGDISPEEFRRLNAEAMADSKTVAELLALAQLGFDDLVSGARILSVSEDLPSSRVLEVGDVIVGVGGQDVGAVSEVVEAIQALSPGDVIALTVERAGGEAMVVEVELGAGDDGGTLLGVLLTAEVELPFDIEIDSGDVVGSSAGLAYALALIDYLSPGELTGGIVVGVTGELASDGSVGAVGGLAQKTVAVARAGGELFLVPAENLEEARAAAPDGLEVVGVSDLQQALDALAERSGTTLAESGRQAA